MPQGCSTIIQRPEIGLAGKGNSVARSQSSGDDSEGLRRIVQIIVHDFNGDSSAYFNSVMPARASASDADEQESKVAHRFTKSV